MRQYKHQICLLQYKVVWRRADHISLGRWYSNTNLVTVTEPVQTQADHGRGPQCVQKHIAKRTAILKSGSKNKLAYAQPYPPPPPPPPPPPRKNGSVDVPSPRFFLGGGYGYTAKNK